MPAIRRITVISREIATVVTIPPRNIEPVSPINILAGCQLKIRNPIQAPMATIERTESSALYVIFATKTKNISTGIVTPVASPSIQSVKFTALVKPIIAKNQII